MTTEELIKSLRTCANFTNSKTCADCHFQKCDTSCLHRLLVNAADQLEALVAELGDERYRHDRYVDFELAVERQLTEAKAERDAAIADIKRAWLCAVCKKRVLGHEWLGCKNKDFFEQTDKTLTCANFEWRGVMPDGD